jgi:hypothetical protein
VNIKNRGGVGFGNRVIEGRQVIIVGTPGIVGASGKTTGAGGAQDSIVVKVSLDTGDARPLG